jgi:hypothetical protein
LESVLAAGRKGPIYVRVKDNYVSDGGSYTLTLAPQ